MKKSEMGSEVELLDMWASMFGMRARIALAEKGIEYQNIEQDLDNKGDLLLQMNPIHKKVPVLVHNGNPICESLNIIHYIDEVWPHSPPAFLPSDAYGRAQARFWADYTNQVFGTGRRVWTATTPQDRSKALGELLETLKNLEDELGDKAFFGGDHIGIVDIALLGFYPWFSAYEKYGEFSMEAHRPGLVAWANRCLLKKTVSDSLPHGDRIIHFVAGLRKRFGIE